MVSAKSLSNRSKNFSKMSNSLLQNKYVLYFVFILAVGNLFHFVFRRDLMSVGIFIAAGLLTSFFSKNMIVVMTIAMVVANITQFGKGRDGFSSNDDDDDDDDDDAFANALDDDDDDDDDDHDAFGVNSSIANAIQTTKAPTTQAPTTQAPTTRAPTTKPPNGLTEKDQKRLDDEVSRMKAMTTTTAPPIKSTNGWTNNNNSLEKALSSRSAMTTTAPPIKTSAAPPKKNKFTH